jgi:hypothetical protein
LNDVGCDTGVGPANCLSNVGTQNPATSCDACAAGTFGGGGETTCGQCPKGWYSDSQGSPECVKCSNGKFQNQLEQTGCTACPFGQVGTGLGKQSCAACAPGQHSVDPGVVGFGATECSACASGKVPSNSKHGCDDCGVGKYRDPATFICETCSVGTYSATTATESACPGCPVGRYGPNPVEPCEYCPSGQVQAAPGQPTGTAPEVCSYCTSGQHSVATTVSNTGASECIPCVRGKSQNHADRNTGSTTSHTCIDCPKGTYNGQNEQAACSDCAVGMFQPAPGTTGVQGYNAIACKSCSIIGNTKYQDVLGQETCKSCPATEFATPGNAACSGCKNWQYPSNGCTQCQGCPAGSFNPTGCPASAQGACESCLPGYYKSEDDSSIQSSDTELPTSSDYGRTCTACSDCSAGKYRKVEDSCRLQQSFGSGTCSNCPQGYFSTGTLQFDQFCTRCNTCDVGQERVDCSTSVEGTCQAWPAPIITSVSGPGTKSGITNGGDQIVITGRNFVGPRGLNNAGNKGQLNPTTHDIMVRYGGPAGADPSKPMYYLDNCVLSLPCSIDAECSITCLTTEGVGKDLNVEIVIFKDAASGSKTATNGASATYSTGARVTYAAPLISEYEGTGADRVAKTVGSELLVIRGANFGPPCPAPCPWINKAELVELIDDTNGGSGGRRRRLADPKVYVMDHTACFVTSHTRMSCYMPEGAGKAFKVILTIGGQSSIETQMSYGPPSVISLTDVGNNPIDTISTRGSEMVILTGENFANTHNELDSVRFGSALHGYKTFVVVSDTAILTESGTCQIKDPAISIRCLTFRKFSF